MPATKRKEELPSTLQRSPAKAQRTWAEAHDSAVKTYGEGQRAHRTAYSALKHSFEKRGDRWVPKDSKGPSDPQAKKGTPAAQKRPSRTYGGVDVEGNNKQELMERAKKLEIRGRSRMTKSELAGAIASRQRQQDRKKKR